MRRLIWKNIRQRKAQSLSLVLSVCLAVMAFVALWMVYGGMSKGIALSEERSGAQLLVIPEDAESSLEETDFLFTGAPVSAYIPADLAEQISQIEGVERVSIQFYGQTIAESCCSTSGSTRIIGFDPETDWVITPYADRDISDVLAEDEIIIGSNITGFESGEGLVYGKNMKVAAVLEPTGTYLDNSLLMDIDTIRAESKAQDQFDHYWKKYGEPETLASAILVETQDGDQSAVAGKIKRKVDGDISVIVRSDVIADSQESLSVTFITMLVAGAMLAIASLLQLVARFYSLVWERRAELALYRALGAKTSDLRKVIGGEALSLTGMGIVAGAILGVLAFFVLVGFMQGTSAFPYQALSFGEAALGFLIIAILFVIMAVLSIIAPLCQVKRIDPASAMQQLDIG